MTSRMEVYDIAQETRRVRVRASIQVDKQGTCTLLLRPDFVLSGGMEAQE